MGKRTTKPAETTPAEEPAPAPVEETPAGDDAPAADADAPVDEAPAADEQPEEPAATAPAGEGGTLIGDGEASRFRIEHTLKTANPTVVVVKQLTGNPVPVLVEADGQSAIVVDFEDKVPGVDTFRVSITK